MSQSVTFSIIVPVKKINDFVRENVSHLINLKDTDWELFIVTDYLEKSEWPEDFRIKILESGVTGPAKKRDLAALHASGDFLVFLDDDSYPAINFLKELRTKFQNSSITAIGGPGITPPTDGFWETVSGSTFETKWAGSDPERYLPIGSGKSVQDWPSVNLSIRKSEFLQLGGFDSKYWPGEDSEFCAKLVRNNRTIYYSPEVIVFHHRRRGLKNHLIQVGNYGLHRGYFVKKFPENSLRFKYFLPSAFLIYIVLIIILIFEKRISAVILIPGIIYSLRLSIHMLQTFKRRNFGIAFFSCIYVFISHIWYGFNFIKGLLTPSLHSKLRKL